MNRNRKHDPLSHREGVAALAMPGQRGIKAAGGPTKNAPAAKPEVRGTPSLRDSAEAKAESFRAELRHR